MTRKNKQSNWFFITVPVVSAVLCFLLILVIFYMATYNVTKTAILLNTGTIFLFFGMFFTRFMLLIFAILGLFIFITKKYSMIKYLGGLLAFVVIIEVLSYIYPPEYCLIKGAISGANKINQEKIETWLLKNYDSLDLPENEEHYFLGNYPDWAIKYNVQHLTIYNYDDFTALELNYGNRVIGSYSYYLLIDNSDFKKKFPHLRDYSYKISENWYLVCQQGFFDE